MHRRELLVAGLILAALSLWIGVSFWRFDWDDCYITYRIAENIANGKGWVYNQGERINGATSVLWTGLLAIGHVLRFHTADVAHFVALISLFASGLLSWILVRPLLSIVAASAAVLLSITHPRFLMSIGMESQLMLACALLAFLFSTQKRWRLLAIALGALILTRPDGVLLAVILLGKYAWEDRRGWWRPAAYTGILVAPWFLFSRLYFGQLVPNTLAAKMAQGRSGNWQIHLPSPFSELPVFLKGAWLWWGELYNPPLILLGLALVILGLVNKRLWSSVGGWIIAWGGTHLAAYSILNVPHYHWYYTPVWLAIAVSSGFGVDQIERLSRGALRPWVHGSMILALSLILYPHIALVVRMSTAPRIARDEAYRRVALWLKANTPREATIAAEEIGVVGYYSDRRIVDMTGIIDPDGPRFIGRGDLGWWIEKRPQVVIVHDPMGPFEHAALRRTELVDQYELWKEFNFEGYSDLLVFRLKALDGLRFESTTNASGGQFELLVRRAERPQLELGRRALRKQQPRPLPEWARL